LNEMLLSILDAAFRIKKHWSNKMNYGEIWHLSRSSEKYWPIWIQSKCTNCAAAVYENLTVWQYRGYCRYYKLFFVGYFTIALTGR
jgi:hypothetical protein